MIYGVAVQENNAELGDRQPGIIAGTSVYVPLLLEQLKEEASRTSSLEQRGLAVITTSGGVAALLFGLAAVVTASETFVFPDASRALLVAALVLFMFAAVGGIVSNWPFGYRRIAATELERLIGTNDYWSGRLEIVSRRVAEAQVSILERVISVNEFKGRSLLAAMFTEVLAVIVLSAAVGIILIEYAKPVPGESTELSQLTQFATETNMEKNNVLLYIKM
jgi:hypothetical protein